jgi:hypothetical protein
MSNIYYNLQNSLQVRAALQVSRKKIAIVLIVLS